MRKLLRANLFRLRRSRALWLCAAAAFVLSALYLLRVDAESTQTLDQQSMQMFPFLPILHAAFVRRPGRKGAGRADQPAAADAPQGASAAANRK